MTAFKQGKNDKQHSIAGRVLETKEEIELIERINKPLGKWKRKTLLYKEIETAGLPSPRPQAKEKVKAE